MTIWVLRNGHLVDKARIPREAVRLSFPSPHVSRFESFESPIVEGKTISSWRQRDADMQAGGAVDPRDLDRAPFEKRAADAGRAADSDFQWGDTT